MYYYIHNETISGPISEDMLVVLYAKGEIDDGDIIKKEGMSKWVEVKTVGGLKERANGIKGIVLSKENAKSCEIVDLKSKVNKRLVYSIVVSLGIAFAVYLAYDHIQSGIKKRAEEEMRVNEQRSISEYKSNVLLVAIDMQMLAIEAESVVEEISKEWRSAIFDEYKKRDFNLAIIDVKTKNHDIILSISNRIKSVQQTITNLKVPVECKEEGRRIRDIFLSISKYAEMATDPSGSLQSYSAQSAELKSDVQKLLREMKMISDTR